MDSFVGKRQRHDSLRGQLENEKATFLPHWRDLSDHFLPRRARFTVQDVNRGDRRNTKIIDSTGPLAARTLRSGMMGGITSPARPWFKFGLSDGDLMKYAPVKDWLGQVASIITDSFLRSNLYNALPSIYGDIGVFATSAMYIEEDLDDVMRFYTFPIGSYSIANNHKLKVDVFLRDFRMTVRQVVQMFGKRNAGGKIDWSNLSSTVQSAWERGEYETWIDICHEVSPNPDWDPKQLHSKFKRYQSCYYERGYNGTGSGSGYMAGQDTKYLRESGYDRFPVLCPRWETTAEDVYGTSCPGMDSLGDNRALQLMHRRKAEALDKLVRPPMVGPTSLQNRKASIVSGDITYEDVRDGQRGFRAAHDIQFRLNELKEDILAHQQRIDKSFYADLFLMLANDDRSNTTAMEISERKEEKLIALGPVLEQFNQDGLDPLIDMAYDMHVQQGRLPEPPEELDGMPLKIEYISVMAQAQKIVGIGGMDRFITRMNEMGAVDPSVWDKINKDKYVDIYGDLTSVPPGIVRPDEEALEIRSSRADAAAKQQKMANVQAGAAAASDLAGADMSGDNALTRMLEQANAGALAPAQ